MLLRCGVEDLGVETISSKTEHHAITHALDFLETSRKIIYIPVDQMTARL